MIAQTTRHSSWLLDQDDELATLLDARKIAAVLRKAHPYKIHAIWLFGSVARNYVGADLDLVLEVDETVFQDYLDLVGVWCGYGPENKTAPEHTRYRERRFQAAGNALYMWNSYRFDGVSEIQWNSHYIDLHVFPVDWRDRLAELQDRLGHHDPKFMENVAYEAMSL